MENNIINVFRYIQQLYKEVAQVMHKLDDLMEKKDWETARGNTTTSGVSKDLGKPEEWLPLGSFRLYKSKSEDGVIRGVTFCYEDEKIEEPIIIIGKLAYKNAEGDFYDWDMWHIWLDDKQSKEFGKIYTDFDAEETEKMKEVKLIAYPLLDIKNEEDIKKKIFDVLMEL